MAERLIGQEQVARKLAEIASRYPEAIKGALYRRGQAIMRLAKRRVPVDLGPLRASGRVHDPQSTGRETSVTLSFGGPSTPYAAAVHEAPPDGTMPELLPPSWRGKSKINFRVGGPKYLEGPVFEALPTLARDLGDDLDIDRVAR